MSVYGLAAASKLRLTEARLGVRFPPSFRRAVEQQQAPTSGSRFILLPIDEIDTTYTWGVPGDGVVVARSLAGGYVVLTVDSDDATTPRSLKERPPSFRGAVAMPPSRRTRNSRILSMKQNNEPHGSSNRDG